MFIFGIPIFDLISNCKDFLPLPCMCLVSFNTHLKWYNSWNFPISCFSLVLQSFLLPATKNDYSTSTRSNILVTLCHTNITSYQFNHLLSIINGWVTTHILHIFLWYFYQKVLFLVWSNRVLVICACFYRMFDPWITNGRDKNKIKVRYDQNINMTKYYVWNWCVCDGGNNHGCIWYC